MNLEITGKLLSKLPQQSGQGKNGVWVKQEFVIETDDQFPKKVCIQVWGDKTKDLNPISEGDTLKASINIESREFNGKWYTDVKAWRIEKQGDQNTPVIPPPPDYDSMPPFPDQVNQPVDDLPF